MYNGVDMVLLTDASLLVIIIMYNTMIIVVSSILLWRVAGLNDVFEGTGKVAGGKLFEKSVEEIVSMVE